MFSFSFTFLNIVLFICVRLANSLIELQRVPANEILSTELVIRNTINKLFACLKLPKVSAKSRLKQYSTIHKYFISLTLQDYSTLNEIARISRVGNKNSNNTIHFIETINEILGEGERNESTGNNNDDDVILHIEYFLNKINKLKEEYGYNEVYVNINTKVLQLLRDLKPNNLSTLPQNSTEINGLDEDNGILDENEFWEPSGRRVYRGERSRIREFPFMASIHIFNNFHCAGSIIKSDLIVTASSCLQLAYNNRLYRENPAFLSARIGSSYYKGGGEMIAVLEVYFHPDYNPRTLKHNICVLRLTRHIKFRKTKRRVRKIGLDENATPLAMNTAGITIVGWGAREHSGIIGDPWKNKISFAVLDVYSFHDCRDIYSKEYVTRENFCAGFISRGGGACNRDVGGPGISEGKLVGVVSFGSPVCGNPDSPTVFTKVGFYFDWIENIMEQNVITAKKRTTLMPPYDTFTAPTMYRPPKATTFKIRPIIGKLRPVSVVETDNALRDFDETLFKEFLSTMFNSKEIEEYEELLREMETDNTSKETATELKLTITPKITEKTTTVSDEIEDPPTTMMHLNYDEITEITDGVEELVAVDEYTDKPDTYKDTNIPPATEIANESNDIDVGLSKLIGTVDLEKIIEEEVMGSNLYTGQENNIDGQPYTMNDTNAAALLYLSSEEIINNTTVEDNIIEENGNVLSLPEEKFEDLTRGRNTKNVQNILPENELYQLLSEVIQEQISNKSITV